MAIQSMGGAEAGWEVACEVSVPLWVQTPSKALPLLACWRRTPNRCPFGHCWMRDHHSLRSHAPGRIGGVAGQNRTNPKPVDDASVTTTSDGNWSGGRDKRRAYSARTGRDIPGTTRRR